jgi:acetyl-CoA carboxylase biotin carboxyl carrier protein
MTDVTAEMSATVLELALTEGTTVEAGDTVAVLESMKMEIPVTAPVGGTVRYAVAAGAEVAEGDLIARIDLP